MRTREEGRAAREAALREARHSIPVTGIIVGAVAVIAVGYFGMQQWDQHKRSPSYVAQSYIAAWQRKDWPTMKSLATPESARWIDALAMLIDKQKDNSDFKMKLTDFEETEYRVDSVDIKGNTVTVNMRKSRRTVLLETQPFILVRSGDTWKVDVPKSTRQTSTPFNW